MAVGQNQDTLVDLRAELGACLNDVLCTQHYTPHQTIYVKPNMRAARRHDDVAMSRRQRIVECSRMHLIWD